MSLHLALQNLLAYSLQIGVLILIGSALPLLFRVRPAAARLAFWHVLLLVCLALPFFERPQVLSPELSARISVSTVALGAVEHGRSGWMALPSWQVALVALLALGAAIRFGFLLAGFWRLRRYRRRARPLDALPPAIRDLRDWWAPSARFYVSSEVNGPVTYGVRRPAVLVPAGFLEMEPRTQEAIACHELLHLTRRDWAFTVAEEVVRALLWFHPAIWWLLGRIQLAREQAVDAAVVQYTNQPEHYLTALLAIARRGIEPDLEPAPLFLKKRHLKQRVASILKGGTMSGHKLLGAMLGMFSVVALTVVVAVSQFPLMAAPQLIGSDGPGVEVDAGAYKLLHRSGVPYPADLRQKGIAGVVIADLTVNDSGEVTDAHIVSGPEALRSSVLQSVLQWHFSNDAGFPDNHTLEISVRFTPPVEGASAPTAVLRSGEFLPSNATISGIDLSGLPDLLRQKVGAVEIIHAGDTVTPDQMLQYVAALKQIDEHLRPGLFSSPKDPSAMVLRVTLPGAVPPRPAAVVGASPPKRIRVGGGVQAANLVQKVMPVYPPDAKAAHVQGVVELEATIGTDGKVEDLQVLSGHPLLVPAALDAVKQWVYRPVLLNGNPVEVITKINVNFSLSQ
jgi:TonB family protein